MATITANPICPLAGNDCGWVPCKGVGLEARAPGFEDAELNHGGLSVLLIPHAAICCPAFAALIMCPNHIQNQRFCITLRFSDSALHGPSPPSRACAPTLAAMAYAVASLAPSIDVANAVRVQHSALSSCLCLRFRTNPVGSALRLPSGLASAVHLLAAS